MPVLSVVVPVLNERENLQPLLARLLPTIERLTSGGFEIIFVDDGSTDGSAAMLDSFHTRVDGRIKVLHFSRNFGHQSALQAGLEAAGGNGVVLMDADLQDPPELLPQFVEHWNSGADVVYAVRKKRKEGILKRAAYATFYRTMRAIAEIDVPLDCGDFCLLDRRVVDLLNAMPEREKFLRGLRSWVGFRQIGVEYERHSRNAGDSKYSIPKLVGLAISGYVGFSSTPLRLGAWMGFLSAAAGFVIALWAVGAKLLGNNTPWGWASTVAIMLFLGGVQLLVLGTIGEYLGRMYDEVRKRPAFIVQSRVGFEGSSATVCSERKVLSATPIR